MAAGSAAVLVEACVTSVAEARASAGAGADRMELCVDLDVGGLTPPEPLVREVVAAVGIPVFAMARPRAGSFVYDPDEVDHTERDIRALVRAGAHGIVIGGLRADGTVDAAAVARWIDAAEGLPVTFHRAFDEVADLEAELKRLHQLGVSRILTGGGPGRAIDNAARLGALVRAVGGLSAAEPGPELGILAAGGIRGDHVRELVESTGAREVHARAAGIPGVVAGLPGRLPAVPRSSV